MSNANLFFFMTDRDPLPCEQRHTGDAKLDRQARPRKPEGLSAAVPDGSVWPATRAHACWSLVAPFLTARSAIAIAASDFFSGERDARFGALLFTLDAVLWATFRYCRIHI